MPDVYELRTVAGERLCEIVQAWDGLDRSKAATRLLGGGWLMQTVGASAPYLSARLRAWNLAEQAAVNAAEASGAVLTAQMADRAESVQILDAPSWSVIVDGQIFEATVKLVVVAP